MQQINKNVDRLGRPEGLDEIGNGEVRVAAAWS
jgi:hypothetical protein